MAALISSSSPGRELHLIDVENLLGTPRFTSSAVQALRETYEPLADTAPTAQQVIATSTDHNIVDAALGWVGARSVFRRGKDGADLALLEAGGYKPERRFRRVVIASGDHVFAHYAAQLQRGGVHVTVVVRPGSLSRELKFAVRDVRFLPFITSIGSAA